MSQHLFRLVFFKLLLPVYFLVGCAVTTPLTPQTNLTQLSILLGSLDENISKAEAMQLSKDIFEHTEKLSKAFNMTSPPLWHNFLVNVGMREKGLCYHWSDALYVYLLQKNHASFEFHLMGANIGEYWYEHNVLVVVEKGGKIGEGIIIDPWRDSGNLYFSKAQEDTQYHWQHRGTRGCKRQ